MTPGRWTPDRRFAAVRFLAVAVGLVLAARMVQVQLVQHAQWRDEARGQWLKTRVVPAPRGSILDREGRPLALTVSSYRVGLSGTLVEDRGALAAALSDVFGGDPRHHQRMLERLGDRYRVLSAQTHLDHARRERLARFPEVNVQEQLGRVYPLDGVGASLLGFYRVDPDSTRHLTGLELGLDDLLAGQPGQARRVQSARRGEDHGEVVVEPARHGRDVILTLDADLQEICESRLAPAVQRTGSASGSILVIAPDTGDILAAASWPLVATRERPVAAAAAWVNRNLTVPYEPGSVFKIFTAAALLQCGAVDTTTVFDCRDGRFGGFEIGEAAGHEFGRIGFHAALALSSNRWFARAVANISPREHFRTLLDLGFGRGTGVPYPNEQDGTLQVPAGWSARSQETIAIGQEVAVTPLQLALAVGAVANGGTLLAPRLVDTIRDERGRVVERRPVRPLRRVLEPDVAAILGEAMENVVEWGTARGIRLDGLAMAGKTGTAQKARPGEGYVPGLYIATFAGYLPADDPRLVIVTVLDEPDWEHHYASTSAAPLFAAIVDDIRRTTDWLSDRRRDHITVPAPVGEDGVIVPDVLYLDAARAAQRLRLAGLEVTGGLEGGPVLAQVPEAGGRVAPGTPVTLTTRPARATEPSHAPDLIGLSNRQVRAIAASLGLEVMLEGTGYVERQDPAPGTPLSGAPITVSLEAAW
ncbi:PASTA domain-containing protein [bacterium]|nr:PASTA domain-containing protein [bacterium]